MKEIGLVLVNLVSFENLAGSRCCVRLVLFKLGLGFSDIEIPSAHIGLLFKKFSGVNFERCLNYFFFQKNSVEN